MFLITQPQVLLSTFPFMQIRVALTASYNLILLCGGILVSKSPNSLFITSESQVFWNQGAILCYRLILGLLVDRNLKSHQTRTRLVWISLLKLFFFANPTALSLHACQTFWDLLSCSLGLWSCVSSLDFCSHTSHHSSGDGYVSLPVYYLSTLGKKTEMNGPNGIHSCCINFHTNLSDL